MQLSLNGRILQVVQQARTKVLNIQLQTNPKMPPVPKQHREPFSSLLDKSKSLHIRASQAYESE
jgi:hypothetical protein